MTPRPWVLVAGAVAAMAGTFLAGRATAPRPKVELHQELDLSQVQASKEDREAVYGALDAYIVVGAAPCEPVPGTAPQPGQVRPALRRPPQTMAEAIASLPPGSSVDLHQGASSEASRTSAQSSFQERARTDLTVTPQTQPRWAVGAGVEDPLGARQLQLTGRMRVPFLGPLWVRAGVVPARGLGGVTVGAEFEW